MFVVGKIPLRHSRLLRSLSKPLTSFLNSNSMSSSAPLPTRAFMADIIGDIEKKKRLNAGPLLEKMDILAGIISARYSKSPVATVSFDRVDLIRPVFEGDLIRLEGKIIVVGKSSMIIQISGYRHDMYLKEMQHTHNALITMVAIEATGVPKSGALPKMYDEDTEAHAIALKRKDLARKWELMQSDVDSMPSISMDMIDMTSERNATKEHFVTMQETEVQVQGAFFPRHENPNHTIFGGEVLTWMDKVALYCARNFTRNENMVTVSMNRIFFKRPIFQSEVVFMRAKVVYVREYTVEIEIKVFVKDDKVPDDDTKHAVLSHTGYFTVLNLGDGNMKRRVLTGISVTGDDEASMKAFCKAQRRYNFNLEQRDLFALSPIPVQNASVIKSSL